MRIIVCLKPVPDPKDWNKLSLDPERKTLNRTGIGSVMNPLDKHALEEALQLREQFGGTTVTVSMGPPESKSVIREALAMGADRAVLLSDRLFAGSDTLGTANVLAFAIKELGDFDVIICGNETIDGGTAQVAAQIAEFLEVPNLMHVCRLKPIDNKTFRCFSRINQGIMEVEVSTPVVFSVLKEINKTRYITMIDILDAEDKEISVWDSNDLRVDQEYVGLENSLTQMVDLYMPQRNNRTEMLTGDVEEIAAKLVNRLSSLGFCKEKDPSDGE